MDLTMVVLWASSDSVKIDLEMTCARCGVCICDAEHGDVLSTLVSVAEGHDCTEVGPMAPDDAAEEILRMQEMQGWSDDTLHRMAWDFLMDRYAVTDEQRGSWVSKYREVLLSETEKIEGAKS